MLNANCLHIILELTGKNVNHQVGIEVLLFQFNGLVVCGIIVVTVFIEYNMDTVYIGSCRFKISIDLIHGGQRFMNKGHLTIDPYCIEIGPGAHA